MKSISAVILASMLALLTACGGVGGNSGNNNPPNTGGGGNGGNNGGGGTGGGGQADIHALNHIVIMMQENRSFDHYFGFMTEYRQRNGIPINSADGKIRDLSDPASQIANVGAPGTSFLPHHTGSVCTEDLSPDWHETHIAMNPAKPSAAGPNSTMNGFASVAFGLSNFIPVLVDRDGHRAMGIFDDSQLNYYYFMASNFAMGDMLFSPAPTRTTSNRLYIHGATSAGRAHADEHGGGITSKTIWRALDEKGVSWKIYLSDWPNGGRFTFAQNFADFGDPARKAKIVSIDEYFADVQNGTLPQVAFIETGMNTGRDEHPTNNPTPNTPTKGINVQFGAAWSAQLINALMNSPSWKDSAFFWLFDEGGGAFDHVPPIAVPSPDGIAPKDLFPNDPPGDFTITGFRIPNFVVSPFAKKNYVSHTPMDYTAILKFIETRFGLQPLTARDAAMPDMTEFFDFNGKPWATPPNPPAQRRDGACDYTQQ